MGHTGSNSLTRDQTQDPCIGSEEFSPLEHPGSPLLILKLGFTLEISRESVRVILGLYANILFSFNLSFNGFSIC